MKLGEICTTNIGLTFKPSNIVSTGVPVYKANNIKNGKINTIDLVFVSEKTQIKENEYLKENDILMAVRSGGKQLVEKTAVIEKLETRTSFGAFMSVIRTLVVIPTYVNYFFHSTFFRNQLDKANTTYSKNVEKHTHPHYPNNPESLIKSNNLSISLTH